jgi:uncharacterized membrane protein
MLFISELDIFAILLFAGCWLAYAIAVERTSRGRTALNARIEPYREVWVRRLLDRDIRMMDVQIMASLQNGTAFFASTSLIAVGGALTVLRASDEIRTIVQDLPIAVETTKGLWELKALGLAVIFVHAFFKFAWAYRLFNYVAILFGAMPSAQDKDSAEAQAHVLRTAKLFSAAGRHFNRGQRAFFFALGYLGWFLGPWELMISTVAVVFVMWNRQFNSDAWRAVTPLQGAGNSTGDLPESR